jgi:hypothetical protein
MIDTRHSYAHRNIFNSGYKVWCITLNIPKNGHRINEWLQNYYMNKYGVGGGRYIESCNWVSIVRRWYLKAYCKENIVNRPLGNKNEAQGLINR